MRGIDLSYNSYITDEVLGELPHLKALQYLALRSNTISDAGFKAIAKLKRLEVLDLNGAHIAETGLKTLAGLEQLQVLRLDWTDMTASAVKELVPLKNLETLGLSNVADTELAYLTELPFLKTLYLRYVHDYGHLNLRCQSMPFPPLAFLGSSVCP